MIALDIQISEGGTYRESLIPGNVFRDCYGSGDRVRVRIGKV